MPEPEAVNDFVWEVMSQRAGTSTVLVHCTHGFNRTGECGCRGRWRWLGGRRLGGGSASAPTPRRPAPRTGYMIVSYCVRMHNWTVEKALFNFALARPPGIYKHYYIR